MQESGILSAEWWFTVVVVGLIIGVVGSIIGNRTDRRLDKYLNKYSERRRQNSEKRRLEFERDVAAAKISDGYRAKLLADLVTDGVMATMLFVFGITSGLAALLIVTDVERSGYFRTAAGELTYFLPLLFLFMSTLSIMMASSRIFAVLRTSAIFDAISKEETSKDPSDSE
jgi:hypothetical protein